MLSVPVAIDRVNEGNMEKHLREFIKIGAGRVFFCLFKNFMVPVEALDEQLRKFRKMKKLLHENNIEAGIWLDDLGHGGSELGYKAAKKREYTAQEGVFLKSKDAFCPLDKNFERDYKVYLKRIAEAGPDIIMFDDDYRLSTRNYGVGCLCKLHREELFKKTGKRYTKLSLYRKAYSGKSSPLREAWLDVTGKSLVDFALSMRETIDSVDENIRLGCCMCLDTLDLDGTDALTLAKAFAGKTKPYFRTSGAPYWEIMAPWGDSRATAEYTRQQMAWFDGEEVEMFAEGDVYPRPRYVVPANCLECYDAYLHADGKGGILKYMFDYKYDLGYETGYIDHHLKNKELIAKIGEAFAGKKQIGIELYEPMQKIRQAELEKTVPPTKDFLPIVPEKKVARFFDAIVRKPYYAAMNLFEKPGLLDSYSFGRAQRLFAANGLPTSYAPTDGAVVCFGESARSLPENYLDRGVILDCRAAKILTERGIDVGFVSAQLIYAQKEEFGLGPDLAMKKSRFLCRLICDKKAEVVSRYQPDDSVASYRYTNANGQRFFVLGIDGILAPLKGFGEYFHNYYRLKSIRENVEWTMQKKIEVICEKNPNLALLAARGDDGSLTVGLFNFFLDGIASPKIEFSEPINDILCIGCKGKITDQGVELEGEIPPYGFAAFTVYPSSEK